MPMSAYDTKRTSQPSRPCPLLGVKRTAGFSRAAAARLSKAKYGSDFGAAVADGAAAHCRIEFQNGERFRRGPIEFLISVLPPLHSRVLYCCAAGAAVAARYRFLRVRCPACRTVNAIDLRTLDRHRDAAVTSLTPALTCRSCRPNAPFAELVRLSRTSIADEMREENRQRVLGE